MQLGSGHHEFVLEFLEVFIEPTDVFVDLWAGWRYSGGGEVAVVVERRAVVVETSSRLADDGTAKEILVRAYHIVRLHGQGDFRLAVLEGLCECVGHLLE